MRVSDLVTEDLPVVDDAAIARLQALAEDVAEAEEDVVGELFRTFHEDAQLRIQGFDGAVDRGDLEAAADAVHALKGASATIGARRLSALCATLEKRARAGDASSLAGAAALLGEELRIAAEALLRGLGRGP